MNLKDYLENSYTLQELILLNDWFNSSVDQKLQNWCYEEYKRITRNTSFSHTVDLNLTIKNLIIERLKDTLDCIRQSADIL